MNTLAQISQFFQYILPVAAVIALAALVVLLIRVINVVKNLTVIVTKTNTTMDGVNEAVGITNNYLKDMNVTVKAVNNMAMSVEAVRATTERAVKKTAKTWNKEYEQVKGWVTNFLEEKLPKKDKEKQENTL